MSSHQYENNNSFVGGGSCQYATLKHYNNGSKGMHPHVPPLPKGSMANTYVVPVYDSPGYNALVHGKSGCCSGYPDIRSAYKSNSDGSCNPKYVNMQCMH